MNEDEKVRSLYPDILERGGLVSVVRAMLEARPVPSTINGFGTGQNYAHVQLGDKSSQIFLCLDERCFSFDFWQSGHERASGTSSNLEDVGAAIEYWLTEEGGVEALVRAFPFVRQREAGR